MSRNGKVALVIGTLVVLAVLGPFIALSSDSSKPEQRTHELDSASVAAKTYIDKYVAADGTAAGLLGFTTQSQALLITAATADKARFDSVWQRTQSLKAADRSWPNTNAADMLVAIRSFVVAANRLNDDAYRTTAKELATQLLKTNELQTSATGDDTMAFRTYDEIQSLTNDSQWATIADNRRQALAAQLQAAKLPANSASNNIYGAAAQLSVLYLKDSCNTADHDSAKKVWLTLRLDPQNRIASSLKVNGDDNNDRQPSAIAAAATAATADVAGERVQSQTLLDQSQAISEQKNNATEAAWAAIGRIVVSTDWLGTCP
jgi:endoglucanase